MALSSSQATMLIGAVAVLLIGGCVTSVIGMAGRKMADTAIQKATLNNAGKNAGVKTNADGTTQVTTSQGTVSTGHAVPADWPKDAPIYPGATVQYSASVNPVDGKAGSALVLVTTDKAATVADYYTTEMKTQGWTVGATMHGGATTIMSATKDSRTFSLALTDQEGSTSISMGIETKTQ